MAPQLGYLDVREMKMHKDLWRAMCREYVDRGAAFARKVAGDNYYDHIDRSRFKIMSGSACVIAQLAQNDMKQFRDDLLTELGYTENNEDIPALDAPLESAEYGPALAVLEQNGLVEVSSEWEQQHGFCLFEFPFGHITYVDKYAQGGEAYDYFDADAHWAILQEEWMLRMGLDAGEVTLVETTLTPEGVVA